MALTNKQELFVSEYLKHFNATKAALDAGYSEKSAHSIGSENLKKPEIAARVQARLTQAAMTADEVLFHLAEIARADLDEVTDSLGNLDMKKARDAGKTRLIKKVRQRTITTSDRDGEGSDISETEVEMHDRLKALELLGKHHKLFTDKSEVETSGQVTVRYVENWRDDSPAETP